MNKLTASRPAHWSQGPLAGRLLPTFWQRRSEEGKWEPYRIDERKLNEILAWIVENVDRAGAAVDPEEEVLAALRIGTSIDALASEISEAAARHLRAAADLGSEETDALARSELPPALRRYVDDLRAQADALLPRHLSDDRQALRASVLEAAIESGAPEAIFKAAELVWATERAEIRHEVERCTAFVHEFGPLLAAPYAEQKIETVALPAPTSVPIPPWPVDMVRTLDEFHQIRRGLLLLNAIQSGDLDEVSALAQGLRTAEADGASHLVLGRMAEDDAARVGTPSGELGFVLKWFVHMATRWPFQVWPDGDSGGLLLPVPVGLSQLIWMVLGHNSGAFRLPFERANNLGVRFCAECDKPIFSAQPRKRGKRWFCDPPPEKERSVCANRYFSREAKKKKRTAALKDSREGK